MTAAGLYDAMVRHRRVVLGGLVLGVVAGFVGASRLRIDMSFRPTFIGDKTQLARTADHERVFGQVGFRDLVAIADVGDATDPERSRAWRSLAERLRRIPSVIEVRDPASFPFFDRQRAPAGARHRRRAAFGHAARWRGGAPLRRGPAAHPGSATADRGRRRSAAGRDRVDRHTQRGLRAPPGGRAGVPRHRRRLVGGSRGSPRRSPATPRSSRSTPRRCCAACCAASPCCSW